MNERMARIEQQVENIEKGVDRIEKALTSHVDWEANKYDNLNNKFSGKWVEKVVITLSIAAISALIFIINNQ
jgi:tetrahydromethanopterin S-methyltransferase subunit B